MKNRTSERHQLAKTLFSKAIELPKAEQRTFLVQACGSDVELLRDVDSLLGFDSPEVDDDFGVFVSASTSLHSSPNANREPARLGLRALAAVLISLAAILFFVSFRSSIRHQIAYSLQTLCETQVRAVRAWEAARIRETKQFASNQKIRSIAKRLVQVSKGEKAREALLGCGEIDDFYAATSAYSEAHDGAALHLVSLDGIVLADPNPDFVGCRINADAFVYVLPVFQGQSMVTPPVKNGTLVVDSPVGIAESLSHSFVMVPIRNSSEVVAALVSMEFVKKGYQEILKDGGESAFITTLIDHQGRFVMCSRDESKLTSHSRTESEDDSGGHLTRITSAALGEKSQRGPVGVILNPYTNHRGRQVVGAWRWVPNSSTGIVVEHDASEMFAPIRQMLLALSIGVAGLLGALFWKPVYAGLANHRRTTPMLINDRYAIEQAIGEGGLATVLRAKDRLLGRNVAVKILKRYHLGGDGSVRRFHREIQVLSNLKHPFTVRIFDAGILREGLPYFVMELVDGLTLAQLIKEQGKLEEARAVELVVDVCSAISEAHSAGVIHRDIKPANVMVSNLGTQEEYVKVLDFGLGKNTIDHVEQLTSTSEITGTLPFLAPEAISKHEEVGTEADVYSLGVLLFYLLTGHSLYPNQSTPKAIHSIVNEQPDLAPLLSVGVSERLRQIIESCLSKRASSRPSDAKILKHLLVNGGSPEKV